MRIEKVSFNVLIFLLGVDMGFSKDNLRDEKQEAPVKMNNLEIEVPSEPTHNDRYNKSKRFLNA